MKTRRGRLSHDEVRRTVLFTDIVASTQELGRIGNEAWSEEVAVHRRSVEAVAAAHRGSVSNFTGDGFMVIFEAAAEGLRCALRLQYALVAQNRVDVRIGVASGDVVEFHDPVIEQRQREIAEEHGFDLVDHSLVLYVRKKGQG